MRLSHHDWAACSRAVQEVYHGAAAGPLSQGLLSVLARLVPADYVAYNEIDLHQGRFVIHTHPDRPDVRSIYHRFKAVFCSHPLFKMWEGDQTVPVKISDVVTVRQLRETAFYQEYYRHLQMRHQLVSFPNQRAARRTGLSFNRSDRDFSERDRAVLAFIAPHLASAQECARKAAAAARSLAAIGEGFQAMRRAVLAAEPDGRIRWQSALACEWLAEFHPGRTEPAAHLPPALKTALDHAAQAVLPRGFSASEFCVSSPSGYRFVVHWGRAGDGSFTLTLVRERTKLNAPMAARYELTGREAEILHWISEAKTNLEITTLLGIGRRTTEKHIEHLFVKLRVQSRVEAQRLAWELRRA
jgi:DNA-binding CsgD family transcriptional regulator